MRVLIRLVDLRFDDASFEITEWNNGKPFKLNLKQVPYDVRGKLHPGFICYVNIADQAGSVKELNPTMWSPFRT